jgi:cell division septation protein DedD
VGDQYSIAADDRQFPEHDRRERPRVRPFFQVKRPLAAALVAALIAGALAIFYFDVPIDYPSRVQARGANPASARAEASLRSQNTPSADTSGIVAAQNSAATPAQSDTRTAVMPSTTWSVQISAAPAKDIADTLIARLKANGYDGYIVPAEINGKTYFRVRVGPFDDREEAESARRSLAQQEAYRDAYLTGEERIPKIN